MTTDDDDEFILDINLKLSEEEVSNAFVQRVGHNRLVDDTKKIYVLYDRTGNPIRSRFSQQIAQSLR